MVLANGLRTAGTFVFWEVGHEGILEPVPGVGSLEGNHTELVGRGNSIAQELKGQRWVGCLSDAIDKEVGLGHPDEDFIGTLEDSSVGVFTVGDEFCLSDDTLLMDKFVSVAWHLIGPHVGERLFWILDKEVLESIKLLADCGVDLSDGIPKLGHLGGARLLQVGLSTESFSVPVVGASWDAS